MNRIKTFLGNIRAIDTLAFFALLNCIVMGFFFSIISQARLAIALPLIGAIMILAVWSWYRFYPSAHELVWKILFPVVLTLLSLAFAFVIPPGATPDEPYHFRASYVESNYVLSPGDPYAIRIEDRELFTSNKAESGAFSIGINTDHFNSVKSELHPFATKQGIEHSSNLKEITDYEGIGPEYTHIRIPSIIGIILARVFNLSCLCLYYLGMLMNMALGIVLVIAAVRITPIGKNAMMAVALLPMTLHLFGSFSYDVGTIGLSLLFIALLIRAIHRKETIRKGEIAALLITGCLLAPCKALYVFSVFLVLFIPTSRFSSRKHAALLKILLITAPFIIIFITKLGSVIQISGNSSRREMASTGTENATPTYGLSDLLLHPRHTFALFLNTFTTDGWIYLHMMVGGVPGWLEGRLSSPYFTTVALLAILGISSLPTPDDHEVLPVKIRVTTAVIVFFCIIAIMVSLCIGWTPADQEAMQGIQGRYFLPILPLILLAMRCNAVRSTRHLSVALMLPVIAIDMTYLGYIIAIM